MNKIKGHIRKISIIIIITLLCGLITSTEVKAADTKKYYCDSSVMGGIDFNFRPKRAWW